MNIHEYQAKQLLDDYGIPVPTGQVAQTAEKAKQQAQSLKGDAWMVKAQVHAGGRGKAGGVVMAKSLDEVAATANRLIGTQLVTHQTDKQGQPINHVLIEETTGIKRELYLSLVIDRAKARISIIASSAGGMDIEEVAATQPDKIVRCAIEPLVGISAYQCREIGFALNLDAEQRKQLSKLLFNAYRLFTEKDLSLLEINPLVITDSDNVLAIDAKINLDDNAIYRHPDLAKLYDPSQEEEKERNAHKFDLNYVTLDGDIACMVNGAGLAMATMDVIKMNKGNPANFLDVGGGTTAEKVTEAFKIILSDTKVKTILVNIFGGIVRCDLIAEGVIYAIKETKTQLPIVVRLEGTNAEKGKQLLKESGLSVITADNLDDAAKKAVKVSK